MLSLGEITKAISEHWHHNCPSCGEYGLMYERNGKEFCNPCIVKWCLTGKEPSVKDNEQLPELEAAQNLAEGCKYEEQERTPNEDAL